MSNELSKVLPDLEAQIKELVSNGFYSREEIEELAVDYFADEADLDSLRGPAQDLTKKAMIERVAEQASWPEVTDCDRLDAAFAEMENNGIISRQNFSCCGNCGSYEIGEPMREAFDAGVNVRGYAFYHEQDTEAAVLGHGICLNYGSVDEGEAAALSIANEIAATFRRHDLQVDWDGTWNKRIAIPLDWKRRI